MPTSSASDASVAQAIAANTHFKITLRRSGISLGAKIQSTLVALGFHRRHQTVYHPHSPDIAGKILRVKELVEVSNVPAHMVRTKERQTQDRKAKRGYKVVGSSKIL
jgi:large subunit ribosomal protein L30